MPELDETKAKPFVKWAGGKGRLVPQLQQFYPKTFTNYFEPFFGGGAVFFSLTSPGNAHINDINDTLMDAYTDVKDHTAALITRLKKLEKQYKQLAPEARQAFYYEQRQLFNATEPGLNKTTLLIFLNKTCFNGLYRENSKGEFNVPFGKQANPTICDEANIRSVARILQTTTIYSGSYVDAVKNAGKGDFVYLDPPYFPLNATSSFTSYHEDGFTAQNQEELRDLFKELDKRGCYVMLSNSSAEFIKELYKDFRQEFIDASRSINSKASERGKIKEIVVLNY